MSASEYTFEEDVLVSGEAIEAFSAASDLTIREPVGISGDNTVDASAAGEGDFYGVVLYDVASGEEVPVIKRDCEVRVPVSEATTAGDELLPDGAAEFETVATSAGSNGVAIVSSGTAGSGTADVEIVSAQGATA